jgi:hypothetical protein
MGNAKSLSLELWERLLAFGESNGGIIKISDAVDELWASGGKEGDRRILYSRVCQALSLKRVQPVFRRVERGTYEVLLRRDEFKTGSLYGPLGKDNSGFVTIRLPQMILKAIKDVPRQSVWLRNAVIDAAVRDGYLEERGDRNG